MDEYNPYADLLPDFTPSSFAGDGMLASLVAGASPGLFEDATSWFGNVASQSLEPIYNFLAGKVQEIMRAVWAASEAAAHLFFRRAYKLYVGAMGWILPDPPRGFYQQMAENPFVSTGDLIQLLYEVTMRMLIVLRDQGLTWVNDRIRDALDFAKWGVGSFGDLTIILRDQGINWVRDRVKEMLDFAKWGVGSFGDLTITLRDQGINWVRDRVKEMLDFAKWGVGSFGDLTITLRDQGINWVRDRVKDMLDFARWGFGTFGDFVIKVRDDGINWLRDRVKDLLGFAAYGFTSMAAFVRQEVQYASSWLMANALNPILNEVKKVGAAVVAGGQDLFGFFLNAIQAALIGPINVVIDTANAKLAIPGKLVRGEYASLDAFITDLMDPAPVILAGLVGVIIIPLFIALVSSGMMTSLVQPLLERPAQAARKRLGDHLMTADDIQESWNRGFLSEGSAVDLLGRIGYGGESLEAMKKLRYRLPPLTDVTRMAVREVFSPSRQALQLDADYPGQVLTDAGKALGLEEIWTRNYWAAHWDLPSPTQGYEMLHRAVINPQQLDDLLKALDYSPAWRGKLAQISYNPLTRVDIRRMYAARVLTETEVKRAYLDIGYNDLNATRLTEFTKRNYAPQDAVTGVINRELTQAQIRLSYRRHVITRDDARIRLIEIGYDAEESEFLLAQDDAQLAVNPFGGSSAPVRDLTTATIREAYQERVYTRDQALNELVALGYTGAEAGVFLALEDVQLARRLKNARANETRQRYVSHAVDYNGALAELTGLGFPQVHAQTLIAEWGAEFRAGERKLTVADVFKALKSNVFNTTQARAYLLRLGYNDADADVLMRLRTGG